MQHYLESNSLPMLSTQDYSRPNQRDSSLFMYTTGHMDYIKGFVKLGWASRRGFRVGLTCSVNFGLTTGFSVFNRNNHCPFGLVFY